MELTLSLVNKSLCPLDMLSLPVQFERGALVYVEDLSNENNQNLGYINYLLLKLFFGRFIQIHIESMKK